MTTKAPSRVIKILILALLSGGIASLAQSANAGSSTAPNTISTQAEIRYSGAATLSDNTSIFQDIELPTLTSDFGTGTDFNGYTVSNRPVMWTVSMVDPNGTSDAYVSWQYSANGKATFTFGFLGRDKYVTGNPSTNCNFPDESCQTIPTTWNATDPIRVAIGPDLQMGTRWWRASVYDLESQAFLDLGSVHALNDLSFQQLTVTDSITRGIASTDCPADGAPIADTYFGPVVDSKGAIDAYPLPGVATHECANAMLGHSQFYTGAYLLYGGSKDSMIQLPRATSFVPSSLIPSAIPPTPDAPSKLLTNIANGILSLYIQVPNFASQGIDAVSLVSPELGFPSVHPRLATKLGPTSSFNILLTPKMLGNIVHLSFFAQSGTAKSNPYVEVINIPGNISLKNSTPTPAPTTSTKPPSKSKPTKATPTPTHGAASSPNAPSAPKGMNISYNGNILIMAFSAIQISGAVAKSAYIVAPLLNGGSNSPIPLTIHGSQVTFEVNLQPTMAGKVLDYSVYLVNDSGNSSPLSGSFTLPDRIPTN